MKHNAEIESINSKKAAIQRIDAQINGDGEGERIVNDYLPSGPVEEKILTAINFLATDSEVSLVDLSFNNGNASEKKSDDVSLLSSGSPLANAITANSVNAANQASQAESIIDNKQKIQTSIVVSGDYDKIRLFIDQLQKISPLNSIKSVSISSQSVDSERQAGSEAGDAANQVASTGLSADITLDFYWMSPVQIDSQKIANFKSGLDGDAIAVVKQYVSQKAPSVEKFGNIDGKRNPFIR